MNMRIILILSIGLVCINYFVHSSSSYSLDTCSPEQIRYYITTQYNSTFYRRNILPTDLSDMNALIMHGKNTNKNRAFHQAVFRLFHNGLKSSMYVNANALTKLLDTLPDMIHHHFIIYKQSLFTTLKQRIYESLVSAFSTQFSLFKQEPVNFLDRLSEEIIDIITKEENNQTDISISDLRKTVLLFLEGVIGKLIWSPVDAHETWESVKRISHQIERLAEYNIIDDPDDLNDLFITLIERYCLFLDINSDYLPSNLYAQIKQDISSRSLFMFELEEQEESIVSKAELMLRATLQAEASYKLNAQP
jgi:hypothetical protein